jgi:hypothetical protein
MTTELLRQITEISNEIKNIYGNDYGEQYSNVAIKLLNQNPNNMNEYHILIEATHSLIDCDYKDKLIISLQKKIKEQEIRILQLEKDNKSLNTKIDILENDNKILKKDNELLKKDNKSLNTEISILKKDKEKFDALVKLHECNSIVNKVFKNEYKKYFNKKRGEYIPNIGDFINDPPTDNNDPDYVFWKIFLTMYPNSDDLQFRNIYYKINNERSLNGAHVDVSMLTENEFDNLMKIIFNDYETNKQLYENYRNWLYKFPIV